MSFWGEPLADRRAVGRHGGHGHVVGAADLGGAGGDRARHAGQMRPAGEEILDRDPGGMSRGHRDLDALLGLHGLMQPVAPGAALRGPAREFVDDHDLAVANDVLPVADERLSSPQRPLDRLVDRKQAHRVEQFRSLERPHAAAAAAEQFTGLLLDVVFVVFVALERFGNGGCEAKDRLLHGLRLPRRRGDDQRRAGLVDEHVVGLVDERKPVGPLQEFRAAGGGLAGEHRPQIAPALGDLAAHQPVLEEVEAEILGRAVGDVAGIRLAPRVEIHLRLHDAHRQPEHLVDRLHPLGVALGKVVVDRGQMGAPAGQGVEHQRQRGDERLSLARLHLDDRPVHERHAGEQLHVVMSHADRPPAGLAGGGKRFDEQRIDRLTGLCPIGKRPGETAEPRITLGLHRSREIVDAVHDPPGRGSDGGTRTRGEAGQPTEHEAPSNVECPNLPRGGPEGVNPVRHSDDCRKVGQASACHALS